MAHEHSLFPSVRQKIACHEDSLARDKSGVWNERGMTPTRSSGLMTGYPEVTA
jgi:hypothetical protein